MMRLLSISRRFAPVRQSCIVTSHLSLSCSRKNTNLLRARYSTAQDFPPPQVDFTANVSKWRFPNDKITKEDWQTFHDEIAKKSQIEQLEDREMMIAYDHVNCVYMFTKDNHPAHPSMMRSILDLQEMTKGNLQAVQTIKQGHYAGDQNAYNEWWANEKALEKYMDYLIKKINELA